MSMTVHIFCFSPIHYAILVPRGRDPFGFSSRIETSGRSQHRESAIHGLILKSDKSDWLKIIQRIFCACSKIGTGQRSRFLVLTKRIAASGDENDTMHELRNLDVSIGLVA